MRTRFRDFMQFVVVTSPHPPAPGEHTWNERIEVTYIYGQIVDWLSQGPPARPGIRRLKRHQKLRFAIV